MTLRLPFIDHINVLLRNLINDKDVALNRPRSYELQILPSSMQEEKQQNPLSSSHAIKPRATVAAKLVFTSAGRPWSANQESSWYVEHAR